MRGLQLRSILYFWSCFCISSIYGTQSDHDILPTIDISLCDAKIEYSIRFICYNAIDSAMREFGTFVAVGHGIEPSFFKEAYNNAKTLFSIDIDNKLNVSMSYFKNDFGRGYIPFGQEAGVATYFEIKEGYSYGFPRKENSHENSQEDIHMKSHKRNPMESLNIWPSNLEDSTILALESVYTEKTRVVKIILEAIISVQKVRDKELGTANGLVAALTSTSTSTLTSTAALATTAENDVNKVVEEEVEEEVDIVNVSSDGDTISLMRLFHYFSSESILESKLEPKSKLESQSDISHDDQKTQKSDQKIQKSTEKTKVNIGSSPHTDWGLLTLILQDNIGGLQFYHNNIWKDVPIVEYGLVVNGGDYLNLISEGIYHSPIHRVLCPPQGKERLSYVFFYYPGFYSKISMKNVRKNDQKEYVQVEGGYNTFLEINSNGDTTEKHEKKLKKGTEIQDTNRETVKTDILTFGDYILRKWRGVEVVS